MERRCSRHFRHLAPHILHSSIRRSVMMMREMMVRIFRQGNTNMQGAYSRLQSTLARWFVAWLNAWELPWTRPDTDFKYTASPPPSVPLSCSMPSPGVAQDEADESTRSARLTIKDCKAVPLLERACGICLDPLGDENHDRPVGLLCHESHCFHADCLASAWRSATHDGAARCPYCRVPCGDDQLRAFAKIAAESQLHRDDSAARSMMALAASAHRRSDCTFSGRPVRRDAYPVGM